MLVSTEGEYKGKSFKDVTGLKKIMLAQLRPFARSLIVRLAEYAKGRKLEASDLKTVEVLTEQAAKNDFRLNDMICELATGDLMRMR
jgi:hypothetical protein